MMYELSVRRVAVGAPRRAPPATAESVRTAPAQGGPTVTESGLPREKFRWSMVESTNYVTYIQNLRAIECPERTICDIITADVDANLYTSRRAELRARKQELGFQNLQRAEQDLWTEECRLINRLLGQEASGALASGAEGDEFSVVPDMPLAFKVSKVDLSGLSSHQRAAIEHFQQRFASQLEGLDPNSAEYAQQWQRAQGEDDAMLKLMLGAQTCQQLLESTQGSPGSANRGN